MCVPFASGNQFLKQKENQDIFLIIQKQLKLKKHQIESYIRHFEVRKSYAAAWYGRIYIILS